MCSRSMVLREVLCLINVTCVVFFQAEDGIRDLVRSRGLGDVYKRQRRHSAEWPGGRTKPVARFASFRKPRHQPGNDPLRFILRQKPVPRRHRRSRAATDDGRHESFHRLVGQSRRQQRRAQAALQGCLLYTSPSPRDRTRSRMPSSA